MYRRNNDAAEVGRTTSAKLVAVHRSTAHIVSAVANVIIVGAFVVGYYLTVRLNRDMLNEMRDQRLTMGYPQVIVDTNYGRLPEVDVVVRNLSTGAAKDISFEFSAPVESSGGFVVSDLPYFKNGLEFLGPEGRISAYWDHLDSLLPFLKEKGLKDGISVTTRYKDLAGESYETRWNLNPLIYEGHRYVHHKGMEDLVEAVEKLAEEGRGERMIH